MTENESLPCPGCHSPLPPEATGCQICMRTRTRQEIMRGYAKLREQKARKKRLPFQILAAVLILGAGGKLFMVYGDKITATASSALGKVSRWADGMRDPSNYASKTVAVPAAPTAPAAPGAPVAPEAALGSQLFGSDNQPEQAPAAAPTPAPPVKPAGPKPLAKDSWRVSGMVYDLATLRPVQGADITFLRDEKEPQTATTDDAGAYEIDLPKGDGWTVSMEARDRRPGQILDIDPPYRERDADERHAAFDQISDGDLSPAQVAWKRSSSKVRLDLIAVPSFWADARRR